MDTSFPPLIGAPLTQQMAEKNHRIAETIAREGEKLGQFIRRRVPDPGEAEDILQDVFYSFVEAYRLPAPIEQVGAWLYRTARNRIIDRFRKKREEPLPLALMDEEGDEESYWLAQVLPAADGDPEAALERARFLDAVSVALAELPAAQREVFITHEVDGISFKEMSAATGIKLNTLLGQKRQAVLRLRARLKTIYDEFA